MDLKVEKLEFSEGCNIIFGHSHFIKTVEDLYEIMVGSTPGSKLRTMLRTFRSNFSILVPL